jgi:hypothetical protein
MKDNAPLFLHNWLENIERKLENDDSLDWYEFYWSLGIELIIFNGFGIIQN